MSDGGNGDLHVQRVGRGPAMLVMHGGMGWDHTYFRPGLDALSDQVELVYYDHRGNGRSGRPPSETITFEQLCADADALRGHLGLSPQAASCGGF